MIDDEFPDAVARLSIPAGGLGGMSRRRFLQTLGIGAGAVALTPVLSRLEAFAAPPIGLTDGVLVLIQMSGGNDGLNTLVPFADPHYYDASLRSNIAIPANQVLDVGNGFGLHPSLPKIKARFDNGQVAIVRGVGYTPRDLSHFSSMGYWMGGWNGSPPTPSVGTGWVGRYLDGLPNAATESLYAATIGTSVPLHLVGSQARASGLPESINGSFGIDRTGRDGSNGLLFDTIKTFGTGPGATGLGIWGDSFAKSERDTMDLATKIQPAYTGTLPNSDLGRQLVLCARLINANLGLRVLNASFGNFDNHAAEGGVSGTHAGQLAELDDAVDAFFAALNPAYLSRVLVMTFSEFGRRPESNDSGGTDHGTASVQFVIGQNVSGGLKGQQPSLTQLDRDGNLSYQVDFRNVYANVLDTWLKADSTQVLGGTYPPLGLFASGPGGGSVPVPPRGHRARRARKRVA